MPTGYTAAIADGITFPQFVWDCARAFGALIMLRDDPKGAPIPKRFEPSPYCAERVAEVKAKLAHLHSLTREQAHAESVAEFQRELNAWTKRQQDRQELRSKYEAMLKEAQAWQPPTPEHIGLKDFMVSQITDSIQWDCSDKYDTAPECKSTDSWLATAIARVERDLSFAEKSLAEEIERTEGRNNWLDALRDSVPPPEQA